MTRETVTNIKEKFFFDQNIFDEDGNIEAEILEEEEPPPPMFSEAELEAEKKAAFEKGDAQAREEEEKSRGQHLAIVLETLSRDIATLFVQEHEREKLYEREAVALTRSLFEKLFPYYAEKTGFDELSSALETVISGQSGKQKVQVQVGCEFSEGVDAFLKKLESQNSDLRFDVQGDESLAGTSCKLSWASGGALHDTQAMAEEILRILKDGLAGNAATGHDKEGAVSELAADLDTPPLSDPAAGTEAAPEEKPDE